MKNEIVMKFEGLEHNKGAREKILRRIQKLPGASRCFFSYFLLLF